MHPLILAEPFRAVFCAPFHAAERDAGVLADALAFEVCGDRAIVTRALGG